jgi:hypothetical protein
MCGFQVAVVVLENLDSKSNPAIESLRRKALPVDRVVVNQTWAKRPPKGQVDDSSSAMYDVCRA